MPAVELVPVGQIEGSIVEFLQVALSDSLSLSCRVREFSVDPARAYSPTRRQYNSTEILWELTRLDVLPNHKVLGVTGVDLFIPILTFVFGQAQLNSRAAVMSVHRLSQRFYGLPEDDEVLWRRSEKEAIHELGHTFGLVHCLNFDCVMHFSNSVEEVDLKSNAFCDQCSQLWRDASAL